VLLPHTRIITPIALPLKSAPRIAQLQKPELLALAADLLNSLDRVRVPLDDALARVLDIVLAYSEGVVSV
jgi:hypothetical protein